MKSSRHHLKLGCRAGEGAPEDEVGGELAVAGIPVEVRGVETRFDERLDLRLGEEVAELKIGCPEVGGDRTSGVDDALENEVVSIEGCGAGAVEIGPGSWVGGDGAEGIQAESTSSGG